MEITDHKLSGAKQKQLPNGRIITPKFVIVHYTAGGTLNSSYNALKNRELSAHLLLDRDGKVVQMVDFNRRALHAGESTWRGLKWLNSHAIGIEVCNYGWLLKRGDGKFQRPPKLGATPVFEPDEVIVADHKNGDPKQAGWEIYPEAQFTALNSICEALLAAYPSIIDIVGHDDVSPARKQDPGPAMAMDMLQTLLDARDPDRDDEFELYSVTAKSGLNMRTGPGTGNPVVRVLAFGEQVRGAPEGPEWVALDLDGDGVADGFASGRFLALA